MARPVKNGLRYFPLDTALFGSRKIQRLLKEHGSIGFATYMVVLCEIYGKRGYYVPYTADFCFDVGFWLEQNEKTIDGIIRFCVKIRLFDAGLLHREGILTSAGVQRRFCEIFKRNAHGINPLYSIEEKPDIPPTKSQVSATETPVIVAETPVIAAKTPVSAAKTPVKVKTKIKEKRNTGGNVCLVAERFNLMFDGRLPKVLKLTDRRKTAVETCLQEYGMEGVERMFEKALRSDFLAGANTSGWRADFDWLLRTDNFLKVMEGNYENKQRHEKQTTTDSGSDRRKAEILRMAAEASAADSNS